MFSCSILKLTSNSKKTQDDKLRFRKNDEINQILEEIFFYGEDIDGNFKWKEKQNWFLSKYLLWAFVSFQITAASKYSYIMLIKRLNCWYEVNFRLYSTYSKANQFSIHTYSWKECTLFLTMSNLIIQSAIHILIIWHSKYTTMIYEMRPAVWLFDWPKLIIEWSDSGIRLSIMKIGVKKFDITSTQAYLVWVYYCRSSKW